jgi:hypothetical protein
MHGGQTFDNAAISPTLLAQAIKQQWCRWEDCRGSRVIHITWGPGTITEIEQPGRGGRMVWVDFGGTVGVKRFLAESLHGGQYFTAITLPGAIHATLTARQQEEAARRQAARQAAQQAAQRNSTPAPAPKPPAATPQPATSRSQVEAEKASRVRAALQRYGVDRLYYMAPVFNVPSVLDRGILSHHAAHPWGHTDFSLDEMQEKREQKIVPISKRPLHDYANLYFVTHTPMQYVLTHDNKWDHEQIAQDELVFIEVDPVRAFLAPGMVFTDGNAGRFLTQFYNNVDHLSRLDWEILGRKRGSGSDYKRLKSAEVLVPDRIPVDWFTRVVVYSQGGANMLGLLLDRYNKGRRMAITISCAYEIDTSLYY